MNKVILDGDYYICICPHCNQYIQVHKNKINCKIFRHAVYKSNFLPINPHESKEECEQLFANNKIYGCGKAFRFVGKDEYIVEICDYI